MVATSQAIIFIPRVFAIIPRPTLIFMPTSLRYTQFSTKELLVFMQCNTHFWRDTKHAS